MGLFRRREPLHERLAREGGLTPPADPRPPWQETGVHGLARPREWDVTTTTTAELDGDAATFVALPDGTLLVEDGPDGVQPLADAVEATLPPPYRARAARQRESLWAVQARRIRVVQLPDGPDGDEFEKAPEPGGRGEVVRGRRLDGDLWEIQVETL